MHAADAVRSSLVVSGEVVQVRRWFPATAEAVAQARSWVCEVAAATGHAPLAPTVELLVSELATNAVRYADGDHFMVEFDANSHVIVAVCDASPTVPQTRNPSSGEIRGRGLAIVDSLSDRWGAELHRDGKCLWFQLDDQPLSD